MGFFRILACIAASLHFLAFLSPQVGQIGRGLRTGLPAFVLACFFAGMADGAAIMRALRRLRWLLVVGTVFIVQAGLRLLTIEDYYFVALLNTYVTGPLQVMAAIFVFVTLWELGAGAVRLFCILLIAGWCASLTAGVPHLDARPGIARETMGGETISVYEAQRRWGPLGIGSYHHYTALAISFLPMAVCAARLGRPWRWLLLLLVAGAALAVSLSTFTMATGLLLASAAGLLVYWATRRAVLRSLRVTAAIGFAILVPGLVIAAASSTEHFSKAYRKLEKLLDRTSEVGIAYGDMTGRGAWFVREIDSFLGNPVLGSIGGVTRVDTGQGHSSLSNMLVIHGLVGSIWWFAFLYMFFRYAWRGCATTLERYVVAFTATVLGISGILNPTWHQPSMLGPLSALLWAMPVLRSQAESGSEPLPALEPELAYDAGDHSRTRVLG